MTQAAVCLTKVGVDLGCLLSIGDGLFVLANLAKGSSTIRVEYRGAWVNLDGLRVRVKRCPVVLGRHVLVALVLEGLCLVQVFLTRLLLRLRLGASSSSTCVHALLCLEEHVKNSLQPRRVLCVLLLVAGGLRIKAACRAHQFSGLLQIFIILRTEP